MNQTKQLVDRLNTTLGLAARPIPTAFVKFYRQGQDIPAQVRAAEPEEETLTSCQAARFAAQGEPILLTPASVGCIAAAISLGLVDQNRSNALPEPRVYTDLMKNQPEQRRPYRPPTPKDFTDGLVYACAAEGRFEFCLFGEKDAGRFKDLATARKAIAGMIAIQPPEMIGVFIYPAEFDEVDLTPDVALLDVRPVELTRLVQGYAFLTGEMIQASMGGLRAVNSDLIARPFLTGRINLTAYCLGARIVGGYGADRMGLGMPFDKFQTLVEGVEASRTGYPFELYPGAVSKEED